MFVGLIISGIGAGIAYVGTKIRKPLWTMVGTALTGVGGAIAF